MDIPKIFVKLPAPLLLAVAICWVAGGLLKLNPPEVGAFSIIMILAIVMAGWLYYKDRRLLDEEKRRNDAERDAQQLRDVVERELGKGDEQRDLWTRPILQMPLNQATIDKVLQVFDAALSDAGRSLREIISDAELSKLRANIFLPTSEGARNGDVCNLIIPSDENAAPNGLQRNMHKGDEIKITFRPNQGSTGRVFVEKRAIGVLTHPAWLAEQDSAMRKKIERWVYVRLHPAADLGQPGDSIFTEFGQSTFEMNDFQNRRVVESLAWIISMPILLKTNGALEVVGVFNVDCLEYTVKPEQLRAIYYRLAPFAGALTGVLQSLPTDRVAILRFRG